jgi:hypothetical protein
MSAFIDYCMTHPILTAILIGSAVLMLLLSGMILAMPDQEESKAQAKQEIQKGESAKETIKTDESKDAIKDAVKEEIKKTEIKDEPLPDKDPTPKTERKKKSETLATPVTEEPLKAQVVKESLKESVKEESNYGSNRIDDCTASFKNTCAAYQTDEIEADNSKAYCRKGADSRICTKAGE